MPLGKTVLTCFYMLCLEVSSSCCGLFSLWPCRIYICFALSDKGGEEVVRKAASLVVSCLEVLKRQTPVPIECLLLDETDPRVVEHRRTAAKKAKALV